MEGRSRSTTGTGVYGYATHFSGTNYGIYGRTLSTNGYAGYFEGGRNYFEGNVGIGTESPTSALDVVVTSGIDAISATTNGFNATGVYGYASASSGTNYGVYGETSSTNGYAGYIEGGRNYFEGKVGIGTTSPGTTIASSKLDVFGGHIALSNNFGVFSVQNDGAGIGAGFDTTSADALVLYAGGTDRMWITESGNVGIGTSAPQHKLHVSGNGSRTIFVQNTATSGVHYGVRAQTPSPQGLGMFGWATASSGTNVGVQGESASPNFGKGVYGVGGWMGVHGESSGGGRGVFGLAASYGVFGQTDNPTGWGVWSHGAFGGTGGKYFIQPHPTDASKEIRFVCLEGNESGTYFRGSSQLVNGRAVVEVPEEFRLVSELDAVTVQVTALGPNGGLWVESKGLEQIIVRGNGNVEFDYFVNGIRRGFADIVPIHENQGYVPEIRGLPYGTQFREAHRQILVDNGILNPDFTPNEQKAAEMGWTLRDPTSRELARHEAARTADQGANK